MDNGLTGKKILYICPILIGIIFIISLIPVLLLCKYDCATGDDLGYGTLTHISWINEHSLSGIWDAVCMTVKDSYYAWQGTWFTLGIMALQPEVFSSEAYWITPWIMLFITVYSTTLIFKSCISEKLKLPFWAWTSIDLIVIFSMIQFFPSTASGIFWFNGGAHYIFPYGLALLAIHFLFKYRENRKTGYVIGAGITMAALGGSSYFMPLLVLVILGSILIFDVLQKEKKPIWIMLFPAVLEVAGLIISFLSPGNSNRGGEAFGFSIGKVLITVLISFKEAVFDVFRIPIGSPLVLLCFFAIGVIAFAAFQMSDKRTNFKMPVLILLGAICVNAIMYMPKEYAGVEVSGGVPNTIFQVYLLTMVIVEIYFVGWLSDKVGKTSVKKLRVILGSFAVIEIIALVLLRSEVKETTMYKSYIYLSSGQAEDYKAQMDYNKAILLDDSIKECYLCPINDEQGPLMYMPISEDSNGFTNKVTQEFYQKDLIVVDSDIVVQSGK